jgi:multiple sugar transport system permease protein
MGAGHDQGEAEPEVSSSRRRLASAAEPYLYTAPVLALIAAVMLVPLGVGLSYAFRDLQLLDPFSGGFVGLDHFRELAADRNFRGALRNTGIWSGVSVALQFVLGLILALLLNREFPGKRLVQALVFVPWAVPTFLVGLDWAWLFNPVVGPLPHWMFALHLTHDANNLLSDPRTALIGPIVAAVWWGIPFFAITTLAALQSIPKDLYEAASIDGAGVFEQFRSITLPLLAPTLAITILLRTVWVANFADLIIVMTNGGPADSTQTVASYIFTTAFRRLDFGYASAIATALLLLLFLYSLAILSLRRTLLHRQG